MSETNVTSARQKWNDLSTNVTAAERLLSKTTLSGADLRLAVVLKGKIQQGKNWIESFDLTASSKNAANSLSASAINSALVATAAKAEIVLGSLNQKLPMSKALPVAGTLAGLGAVAYRFYRPAITIGRQLTSPALTLPLPKATSLIPFNKATALTSFTKGVCSASFPSVSLTPYLLGLGGVALSLAAIAYFRLRSNKE